MVTVVLNCSYNDGPNFSDQKWYKPSLYLLHILRVIFLEIAQPLFLHKHSNHYHQYVDSQKYQSVDCVSIVAKYQHE